MSAPIEESSSDEAVEALAQRIGHDLAGHPQITGAALSALADGRAGQHAPAGLRERVLTVIAGHVIAAAEPFIATRVRDEAVAEERQRIKKVRELHPPTSGDNGQSVCATCVNLGEHDSWPCATLLVLAAGSVPVATSADVDSQSLAEVGDRVPVMAVLTVGGRWVACTVTDAGVTGGFRTWQGVPEDADLRRSEVHSIWSDVPPWSPAIGLLRFPDELADGA